MNFLEQLVSEWYEYKGYFLRRNARVGRLPRGGYECELDVVAFHPKTRHLVHVEPSTDASSMKERDERYAKKFSAGRKYIPDLLEGLPIDMRTIDQYSIVLNGNRDKWPTLGGCRYVLAKEFFMQILRDVKDVRPATDAIPESFSHLRLLQALCAQRKAVIELLSGQSPVA